MRWMPAVMMLVWMQAAAAQGTAAQDPAAQAPAARPRFEAFEVATIKPVELGQAPGRYIKMESNNRFIEKAYTLKLLIAAAYDLNPKTVSGGPAWMDDSRYNIEAVTPGSTRPSHDEQMMMLRALLVERFGLKFHREDKVFSIYELQVAKGGPKLKASASAADEPAVVGPGVVYPQKVVLPGRNATVGALASLLQRAILDRPVVDKTGLSGRYDFDLDWAPDETQFGGGVPTATEAATSPPLFEAMQQELGLKLEPVRGPVSTLVVDQAEKPTAN
jgi:uncharacterized protein (TIGR03435 family)